MSRIFTDSDLLTWEAYASAGKWGLPNQPKIVFNCVSDPSTAARYMTFDGHNGEAEDAVHQAGGDRLREMLASSKPL
ncbi:hypothetical protein BH23GEM6_BH23GEM6_17790 [soil metagenome]